MSERALAVDIGGTKIAVGLVDATGRVECRAEVRTPAQEGADAVLAAVLDAAGRVLQSRRAIACGVGTAGVVGPDGDILSATDLLRGWAGTPVARRLEAALHLPVSVLNDVHATALCEARLGSAVGHASALVVAVGTGIGGAVVRNGEVLRGAHGIAGSVGHLPCTIRRGRKCSCGALDHVEAYASGLALEAEYARRTGLQLDLRRIARAIGEGDTTAGSVVAEGATALGTAIGGANNVVDADIIVIGGGVAMLQAHFFEPLRHAARQEALGLSKGVDIVPAQFGADACLVGAGLAGLEEPRRRSRGR